MSRYNLKNKTIEDVVEDEALLSRIRADYKKKHPASTKAQYANLAKKTIFDICKDEELLNFFCEGYSKESIISGLGHDAFNPHVIEEFAFIVNDEALIKAIKEQTDTLCVFGRE